MSIIQAISLSQIAEMLRIQDETEIQLDPNWLELNWPFELAILVELGELGERVPWKWWKDTNKQISAEDLEQIHLELVDIWHFGISIEMIHWHHNGYEHLNVSSIAEKIFEDQMAYLNQVDTTLNWFEAAGFQTCFRQMMLRMASSLYNYAFDLPCFFAMCSLFKLQPYRLYQLYIAKNVLNRFRQAHGYKEGTYDKIWQGREDNAWLMDLVNESKMLTAESLASILETMYKYRNEGDLANLQH